MLGSVINRKARNFKDDLDKREGFKKQLDDLTEAVKKLQDEFDNNGEDQFVVALIITKVFIYCWLRYTWCLMDCFMRDSAMKDICLIRSLTIEMD